MCLTNPNYVILHYYTNILKIELSLRNMLQKVIKKGEQSVVSHGDKRSVYSCPFIVPLFAMVVLKCPCPLTVLQ